MYCGALWREYIRAAIQFQYRFCGLRDFTRGLQSSADRPATVTGARQSANTVWGRAHVFDTANAYTDYNGMLAVLC
jgi:hypothetical protein